jgi:hypothetical protein
LGEHGWLLFVEEPMTHDLVDIQSLLGILFCLFGEKGDCYFLENTV